MNGLRKFKRERLRKEYKKFCDAWNAEAVFRRTQGSSMIHPKKPTFNVWMKVMEKKELMAARAGKEPEPEISDLEWKE